MSLKPPNETTAEAEAPPRRRAQDHLAAVVPLLLIVLLVVVFGATVVLMRSLGAISGNTDALKLQQAELATQQLRLDITIQRLNSAETKLCERVNASRLRLNADGGVMWLILDRFGSPGSLLDRLKRELRWQPLVDCTDAIGKPDEYLAPEFRRYNRRQAVRWVAQNADS